MKARRDHGKQLRLDCVAGLESLKRAYSGGGAVWLQQETPAVWRCQRRGPTTKTAAAAVVNWNSRSLADKLCMLQTAKLEKRPKQALRRSPGDCE